mgnify:CR=1 FL=1
MRECGGRGGPGARPPGGSRDVAGRPAGALAGILSGADEVVVFAGYKEQRGLVAERVKGLCGCAHPVIVDGRNVVEPDAWLSAGFAYRGIGREDKNGHLLAGMTHLF